MTGTVILLHHVSTVEREVSPVVWIRFGKIRVLILALGKSFNFSGSLFVGVKIFTPEQ